MKVEISADYGELSRRAAQVVLETWAAKPRAVLIVPTGNTPVGLYRELAAAYAAGWEGSAQAPIFALDEYVGVPPHDEHSFARFLYRHLIDPLQAAGNFDHLHGDADEPTAECRRYERAIAEAGGLDLAILGLGVNGHIAFNEPGTAFDSRTQLVELAESTREANKSYFADGFFVPRQALTVGIGTILTAKRIMVLASGASKASVVAKIMGGQPDIRLPASALLLHDHVDLLVDEEAARDIK